MTSVWQKLVDLFRPAPPLPPEAPPLPPPLPPPDDAWRRFRRQAELLAAQNTEATRRLTEQASTLTEMLELLRTGRTEERR